MDIIFPSKNCLFIYPILKIPNKKFYKIYIYTEITEIAPTNKLENFSNKLENFSNKTENYYRK
jgi:hypothetical protein